MIIIIAVVVLILSYFNIDVRGIIEAPQTQENFAYIKTQLVYIWNTYLSDPVLYFWNNIFIDLLWESFTENLERIKLGEPEMLQQNAPQVPQN